MIESDEERRFGGLRRLWGEAAYAKVRSARVAVVGVGGVGSWAVEALARCGVAELVLIDLDQVSESNINRQIQALGSTVGAAKVDVLKQRIADIHPGCRVHAVDAFVEADTWPDLLPVPVDALIDACDQGRAKLQLALWAIDTAVHLVTVGAAGGKTKPQAVEVDDLFRASHDPLLARLRQHLRKAMPTVGAQAGITCVFSREPLVLPGAVCDVQNGLNCGGYGSSVMVTGAFGLAAAEAVLGYLRNK